MRKTIGTIVGLLVISICMLVSFQSAVKGEKQRKEMERVSGNTVLARARISESSNWDRRRLAGKELVD